MLKPPPPVGEISDLRPSAIDDQLGADHIGGVTGRKKQGCGRNLARFGKAFKRDLIGHAFAHCVCFEVTAVMRTTQFDVILFVIVFQKVS